MGVGAESEACVVVTQHTAYRLYVNAVLEGYCGEGVSEAMERNVLQIGLLEDLLVELCHGVGMIHLSSGWGWEHVLIVRVFNVFLGQEVNSFLWDRHSADGSFGLGTGEGQFAAWVADVLFADEDRAVLYIQVIPEEGNQLTFPEAADQS